jgi:hypothetical protein
MIQTCCIFHRLIQNDDRVRVMMDAVYVEIASDNAWALKDDSLQADKDTLCHKWCDLEDTDE